MKASFGSLAWAFALFVPTLARLSPVGLKSTTNVVPNRFIIEVESLSDIPGKRDVVTREVSVQVLSGT